MCADCDWEEALEQANRLLDDGRFVFATQTVEGIADWIESNQHVTDAQQEALNNIERSKQ